MTVILIVFLVLLIIGLLVWINKLNKSLKEHFEIENALQYEVGHDELTGLVNASLTIDRLGQAIKNAQRYNNKIAVLYLGLDYFKQINSAAGFDIDNEFLQVLSQKFLENIASDDTVASVNGSEFVFLLEDRENSLEVQSIVDKIMAISYEVFEVQHHKINVSFSIGISIYPNDHVDTITLLSHAFSAMNIVKENGGNGYKYYTPELAKQAFLNGKLEEELIETLKNNQMEVNYQLQVNSLDSSIIGIEALARWRHPTMGLCISEQFIALAEEIGCIVDIDKAVIYESVTQFKKWHEIGLVFESYTVNISVQTLMQKQFVQDIETLLIEHEFLKKFLIFELNEKQLMKNPQRYMQVMGELHSLGVKFYMENCGSSSMQLDYLQKLPISCLKIDRSIVIYLESDTKAQKISKSIISIAKNMDLGVMAECVESEAQRDFLVKNSCTNMQGFLFYKPLTAELIEKELKKLA